MEMAGTPLTDSQIAVKREINERMNKLATELSMAEDKLKQMFGLEDQSRRRLVLSQASLQSFAKRQRKKTIFTTGLLMCKP